MRQRPRALLAVGTAAGLVLPLALGGTGAAGASPAGGAAAPTAGPQSQVSALEGQLEAQANQISALDERYNQAMVALQSTQSALGSAQAAEAAAQAKVSAAEARVKADAVEAYMLDTPLSQFGVVVGSTAGEMAIRHQYADAAFHNEQTVLAGLAASQQQLDRARAQLVSEESQASSEAASARSAQSQAQGVMAAETSALNQAKGQLADAVASQSSSQAQAAAARAAGATSPGAARADAQQAAAAAQAASDVGSGGTVDQAVSAANHAASAAGGSGGSGGVQSAPPAPGGQVAVAAAERELGKPYQWGGAGPNGFDCSGLTMVAWRAAGVYLVHSAAAQYDETTHVPVSDLQPGDLLFYDFGGGGIDHVTMYIGGGRIIEAPHTGANVRILPIWYFDLVGAGRP